MDTRTFEARVRQILALDMNAQDIYKDLAAHLQGGPLEKTLREIANDEARHVALSERILSLLKE